MECNGRGTSVPRSVLLSKFDGVGVESLDQKRSRLRRELQKAYGAWLKSTSATADSESRAQWLAYQAARARLVEANAEVAKAS
jgi:hypothetical protein